MGDVVLASGSDGATGIVILLFLLSAYVLPGIIASARKNPNSGSVWVINIFLGWTFIGWIVALAMAFGGNAPKAAAPLATGWQCPECKAPVSQAARFCPSCGVELATGGERSRRYTRQP